VSLKSSNGWPEIYIPTTSFSFLSSSNLDHGLHSGNSGSLILTSSASPKRLACDEF